MAEIVTTLRVQYLPRLEHVAARAPIPILIAGAILRAAGLGASALWFDEAYSLSLARLPLLQLVRVGSLDLTPPLWELVVKPFVWLFGANEIALRLPALISSWVALWLGYKLARELIKPWGARLAAIALISLLPGNYWIAQEGRVYALYSALYLAALWFALRGRWWGLGASSGLLLWAHMTSPFYLVPVYAIAYLKHKNEWKKLSYAAGAALLSILPWLSFYQRNSQVSLPWVEASGKLGAWLMALDQALFALMLPDNLLVFAGWFMAGTILLALIMTAEPYTGTNRARPLFTMGLAGFGPMGMMIGYSLGGANIIYYRPLTPLIIPLSLWLAAALFPRRLTLTTWIIPYTWAALLLIGMVRWSPAVKGGDLREIAATITSQLQPGDVIYHAAPASSLQFSYYLPGPQYVMDDWQHLGLDLGAMQAFGIQRAALDNIPHKRAWLIWPQNPDLAKVTSERMASYAIGAQLIGTVESWQFASIQVYLQEGG